MKDLELMLQGNHCLQPVKVRPICGGRWRIWDKNIFSTEFLRHSSEVSTRSDGEQNEAEIWH